MLGAVGLAYILASWELFIMHDSRVCSSTAYLYIR